MKASDYISGTYDDDLDGAHVEFKHPLTGEVVAEATFCYYAGWHFHYAGERDTQRGVEPLIEWVDMLIKKAARELSTSRSGAMKASDYIKSDEGGFPAGFRLLHPLTGEVMAEGDQTAYDQQCPDEDALAEWADALVEVATQGLRDHNTELAKQTEPRRQRDLKDIEAAYRRGVTDCQQGFGELTAQLLS